MTIRVFNLFEFKKGHYLPCAFSFLEKLWWRFIPGVIINVKWPTGHIVVNHDDPRWIDMGGAVWVDLGFSSDPNEHYRPFLEKHIGKQGWDWNWGLIHKDVSDKRITIKIRQKYASYASILALRWS